ncbi:restriction endonuclease subunit S [Streptomyces sp. NPDC026659]|uniref:restriction endonuclease subunit S n=1 Tax=Streptomyces sp. NPDC026659 TaxID=3155123 RepID=UPI0033CCCD01
MWTLLSDIARLESGHTPSRRHAEYWDGDVPWIGIKDATGNHGRVITSTLQTITQAGLDNSSARLLPAGTVCLSRTASVGYVVTMGVPMATSQDFINWVCGPQLSCRYLHYILVMEQDSVRRFAHGTTHQTVYYPEAKAFHVCIPSRGEQDRIVSVLGALDDKIAVNERISDAGENLAVALASGERWNKHVRLDSLCELRKYQVSPQEVDDEFVDHYSLPAFDSGKLPVREAPVSIKSGKFLVSEPAVLLSKLNPDIPRVWNVMPNSGVRSLASTEFLVLVPRGDLSVHELWAVTAQQAFLEDLASKVTGTSKSHQRVRPAEVLESTVVDPRQFGEVGAQLRSLASRSALARRESQTLATLRDTLLPQLMSGRLRVKDAEKIVEDHV